MGIFTGKMNHDFDPLSHEGPVPSPCIGVCVMEKHSGLCSGCTRTINEIAEWGMATDAHRRAIWVAIQQRRSTTNRTDI